VNLLTPYWLLRLLLVTPLHLCQQIDRA